MSNKKILEVAASAARKAGLKAKELREVSGITVASKADLSLVTSGDYASEEIIKNTILSAFPDHIILSEESTQDWDPKNLMAKNLWIIDPIDGTTNYVYGQPHSGVSIAYASGGEVLAAAVYSIFIDELFYAIKGQGAFLNDRPIVANQTSELSHAVVATGLPYQRPIPEELGRQLVNVSNSCRDLRRLAAASLDLCFVACGRLDAYFETVQSWDMAAGGLIVREAGGVVTNLGQKNQDIPSDLNGENLLASCKGIEENLTELLLGRK
jgi:myo-inositol-1(or 4)-monophosphatase